MKKAVLFALIAFMMTGLLFAQNQKRPVKMVNMLPTIEKYNNFFAKMSKAERAKKGNGFKPFKRWEWFVSQRLTAAGDYPAGARWDVFQDVLATRENAVAQASPAAWTEMGPHNYAGRMLDVAFDPNNSNIIWAGSASGGIWRSPDGGATWTAMDDQLPTLAIGCVVTHNTNSNIIYLGTGEGSFNADAVYGVGVLKSVDGGSTWNLTGLSWDLSDNAAVNEMVMDPTNPDVLIAATRNGVYRTNDAGVSWTNTLSFASGHEDAKVVVIDPANPQNVYVTLGYPWGDQNNGIYKSTDNGATWTRLTNGLPATASDMGRASLTICESNPSVLYMGLSGSFDYNSAALYGVYKTTDGGNNWVQTANSPNFYNNQGWYDNVIAVDPDDPNVVYSGGVDLYKSTDGGVNWSTITNGIHVDQHAIAIHPTNSNIVYAGNDGGMYKTGNGGDSWNGINDGLATMQFYAMGSDANNASVAFAGTQDNGTNRYTGSFTWDHVLGGDGGEATVDFSNSQIVYGEYQNGYHMKSINGGDNWSSINNGLGDGPWVTPVEMEPVDPSILYTISDDNLFITHSGGSSWALLFDATESLSRCIRVAPSDVSTIYVAGSSVMYRTTDGGSSWTNITTGLESASLSSIAVDPTNAQLVYVVSSNWSDGNHVFKSINGGDAWQNVTNNFPNIPCNSIVIDPDHSEYIYVGTDLGTYISSDGGASWEEWNTGLPNVVVDELDIQASSRLIRAATHGRGMWESPLAEPPQASLTVTAPNGGESWLVGSVQQITWESSGNSGNVKIDYSTDGGSAWTSIVASTTDDGSYSWTIPNTPSENALVRVCDVDDDPCDESDAVFTIPFQGILGDVNDDAAANSTDALIILSCDVGLDVTQFCPMNCGDANEDGLVNSTDALIILSYDVQMEVSFPVGEEGCPINVTACAGCNP